MQANSLIEMPPQMQHAPNARYLHGLAGILLLLYAVSHIGFLSIRDTNHEFQNTVFPFLTNRDLYFIAAIFEAFLGILCLKDRGRDITNLLILTFVCAMIWYRWAFSYTGGRDCGCLGLLGVLLHVNQAQGKIIPLATLTLLFLTTTPWLCRACKTIHSRVFRTIVLHTLFFIAACQQLYGAQTITISGRVDLQEYNPETKTPYTNQQSHTAFVTTLSGATWRFCVTNIVWPKWWAEVVYDGTNCYTILPFDYALTIPFLHSINPPEMELQLANIEPSVRFIQHHPENLGLLTLWITYGLSQQSVATNKIGLVEIPFSAARVNPGSFGYSWTVNFSKDGRFVTDCRVVRDKVLDLPRNQELLRFELDYPDTLGAYNDYLNLLSEREATPTGFVKARYFCTDWYVTNNLTLPLASKYEVYLTSHLSSWPWRIVELRASNVVVSTQEAVGNLLPKITVATRVQDYRYKRANNTRIFKYAEYTFNPDDSWKPDNDPMLLSQAEEWLKHGPKYTDFAYKKSVWVGWFVLVLLISPVIVAFWRRNKAGQVKHT